MSTYRTAVLLWLLLFALQPLPLSAEPNELKLNFYLLDLDSISSAEQSFEANVYYRVEWESPDNSHQDDRLLTKRTTDVWHPAPQLVNQQFVHPSFPEVVAYSPAGLATYQQRVWGSFSQPLNLKDFPFDSQTLEIQLLNTNVWEPETRLTILDTSGMTKSVSVPDWEIRSFTVEPFDFTGEGSNNRTLKGAKLKIEVKRKPGYFVAKVITPLVLIVAMSWCVFWIDPSRADTRVSVSVTAMLTLIAYRFAVGMELPPVSYLTRMDHFLISSNFLVFGSLVAVVITGNLAKGESLGKARVLDRWSRVVFPVLFLLATGISFW